MGKPTEAQQLEPTVFVKPASPGLVVRDPGTKAMLPADGMNVELSRYWRRRIADQSVVVVPAATAQAPAPTAEKATAAKASSK